MALEVHFALLASQVFGAFAAIATQYVISTGMDQIVFSFYCCLTALLGLVPVAVFRERKSLQLFSPETVVKLLLLGVVFFFTQTLSMTGIKNTSANFFTSMQPSIPVFGTAFALLMRVDNLDWRKRDGQARAFGILLCTLGATVMAVWHGPCIIEGSNNEPKVQTVDSFKVNWGLGVLCVLLYCVFMAISGCIIASILEKHPGTPISITACTVAIGGVFLGCAGSLHGLAAWQLSWDMNFFAIIFNGLLGAALAAVLINWSIGKVGPILATCYLPVQPAASELISLAYLGTGIYFGSILGTFFIVGGLLLISWSRHEALRTLKQPLLV